MPSDRAKDNLDQLVIRPSLGERLLARIGRRAWTRPRVAVSSRIFKLYRLTDPWDPDSPPEAEEEVGLGPVALRLGENRRQPAPHATPKEPPKPAAPAAPKLPDVPRAPKAPTPPSAASKPATSSPSPTAPQKQRGKPGIFGGTELPPLRGPLPVRPDLARPPESRAAVEAAPSAPSPSPASLPRPAPAGAAGGAGARVRASGPEPGSNAWRRPPLPTPVGPPRGGPARSGRVSLRAATVTYGSSDMDEVLEVLEVLEVTETAPAPPPPEPRSPAPLVELIPPPPSSARPVIAPPPLPRASRTGSIFESAVEDLGPVEDAAPAPPPPKARPARPISAPMPGKKDDLDDLFAASLDAGRMRLGRQKKKPAVAVEPEIIEDPAPSPVQESAPPPASDTTPPEP